MRGPVQTGAAEALNNRSLYPIRAGKRHSAKIQVKLLTGLLNILSNRCHIILPPLTDLLSNRNQLLIPVADLTVIRYRRRAALRCLTRRFKSLQSAKIAVHCGNSPSQYKPAEFRPAVEQGKAFRVISCIGSNFASSAILWPSVPSMRTLLSPRRFYSGRRWWPGLSVLPEFAVQDKFVVIMADNTPRLY